MKKVILSLLAISSIILTLLATITASSSSFIYMYQPKAPKYLK